MTIREQLLAAIAASLQADASMTADVFRSRQSAFSAKKTPAIVITPAGEQVSYGVVSFASRQLDIEVSVIARGAPAESTADPVCQAIHAVMMADRTVGGLALDVAEIGTDWTFDDGDADNVDVTITYQVQYRTIQESL